MKSIKKKIIAAIIVTLGVSILLYGFIAWPQDTNIIFDSEKWLAANSEIDIPTTRQRMLNDIRANLLIPDITAQEIEKKLGKSDTATYFQSYSFVYYLGPEQVSYVGIDSEWLCIKLDDQGKFMSADIRTD